MSHVLGRADDLGLDPESPVGQLAEEETAGVVFLPCHPQSLRASPIPDRSGEAKSKVTLDSALRTDPEKLANYLVALYRDTPFTKAVLSIGADRPRPPLTRRQKARIRARGYVLAALERFDRWREKHGYGPDHSDCW